MTALNLLERTFLLLNGKNQILQGQFQYKLLKCLFVFLMAFFYTMTLNSGNFS